MLKNVLWPPDGTYVRSCRIRRIPARPLDCAAGARSSVDRAPASGAGGRRFESCRARLRVGVRSSGPYASLDGPRCRLPGNRWLRSLRPAEHRGRARAARRRPDALRLRRGYAAADAAVGRADPRRRHLHHPPARRPLPGAAGPAEELRDARPDRAPDDSRTARPDRADGCSAPRRRPPLLPDRADRAERRRAGRARRLRDRALRGRAPGGRERLRAGRGHAPRPVRSRSRRRARRRRGPRLRRAPARRGCGRGRGAGTPRPGDGSRTSGQDGRGHGRHRAVRGDPHGSAKTPSCWSTTRRSPATRPTAPPRPGTRP